MIERNRIGVKLVGLSILVLTILMSAERSEAQAVDRKKATPKKVLRLEEMKVEGRIQKPQAMFLMPRANLNYGDLDHVEPFVAKVPKAASEEPF